MLVFVLTLIDLKLYTRLPDELSGKFEMDAHNEFVK